MGVCVCTIIRKQETEESNLEGKSKNNNKKGPSRYYARGIAFFVLPFCTSVFASFEMSLGACPYLMVQERRAVVEDACG